jgi:hypothetical protein
MEAIVKTDDPRLSRYSAGGLTEEAAKEWPDGPLGERSV